MVVGLACMVVVKFGVTSKRVSVDVQALTSAPMLPNDYEDFKDQVLWQLPMRFCMRIFGTLFSGLLQRWSSDSPFAQALTSNASVAINRG